MNRKILHTHAEDESGNLIHVNDAEKGIKYYCYDPECKKEIIFRNSGKTGKWSKRPHFSHKKGTNPNCSPDRALHEAFKNKLVGLLEEYKAENKSFIFNWRCRDCYYKNSGNLLEKVALIKAEYYLGVCQPDIALLDKEEHILAVIEVVNTHPPEERVLQYYKDNKITLIQINLISDEDPCRVEEITKNPHIVDLCVSQACQSYNKYKMNVSVVSLLRNCYYCHSKILKFVKIIDTVFGMQPSPGFTEDEIALVKSKYNNIVIKTIRNDQGIKVNYPVMECSNCKRFRSSYGRNPRL